MNHPRHLAAAAILLLAGCGSAGTPTVGMPQMTQAQTTRAHEPLTGRALVYAVTDKAVVIMSYPSGRTIGNIPYHRSGQGNICSDPNTGNVFLPVGFNSADSKINEFAPGATTPMATLSVPTGYSEPSSCAVDPTTGNLAVVVDYVGSSIKGAVLVYQNEKGTPSIYSATTDIAWFKYPTYDNSGNLFVSVGDSRSGGISIASLPKGASEFTVYAFTNCTCTPIKLQWDGAYLASEDTGTSGTVIEQILVNGSGATLVNSIPLVDARDYKYFWIYNGSVLSSLPKNQDKPRTTENIGFWPYPKGGSPTHRIKPGDKRKDSLSDLTVSATSGESRVDQ